MLRKYSLLALGIAALALVAVAGCQQGQEAPSPDNAEAKAPPPSKGGEHGHRPGQHGGNIVEIGRDNYHAEAVFEKEGVVRLYLLGNDEAKVLDVAIQTLKAYAKVAGGAESTPFEFAPAATKEDAGGKTSQFTGTLPRALWGKQVEVTVPSIRIAGERFRFFFNSAASSAHVAMPSGASDEKARALYLTPGGKYTDTDVKANGNTTAGQKYGGMTSEHDAGPKRGERICPITDTKANPQFTWVVGGKTYQFCCPPCIDEFVKKAKNQPDKIKPPESYVKE